MHSELSAAGETYRFDFGLIWPINGCVETVKAVNGVISTGPKKPYSFNRDCRHWHIDGSLTQRYVPCTELRPPEWTNSNIVYRYAEGINHWDAAGLFPFVETPTMIIGDENYRIYRMAWIDGDDNYVSTYYQYWVASAGRYYDGPINLVKYTKGNAIYKVAKVRGAYTYSQWTNRLYTIKSWTARASALHAVASSPFVDPDLGTIEVIDLNRSLPDRDEICGDLSAKCLSSLRVQDASIVTDIVDNILGLALGGRKGDFLRHIKDVRDLPNVFADAYLYAKYGIYVPIASSIESIRAYARGVKPSKRPTKCYASGTIYRENGMVTTARCRLAVDPWPDGFRRFIDNLCRLSLGVDFKDLWDLVPLSFLADRFWHVDNVLATDRTQVDALRYNIVAATYSLRTVMSIKRDYVIIDGATDWAGEVQYVDYERWTEPGPILPNYAFTTPSLDGLGECWLDLTSVIVSLFWRRRS